MIRNATAGDARALADIYNHYIRATVATFEEAPVTAREMRRRVRDVARNGVWLVCEEGARVTGFAYAKTWRERAAYRHSVETTVYLHPDACGRGLGAALYAELLARARGKGWRVAVGVIALPNPASVALHERMGFRKAGHLPEIGRKFERWIDVGYWALHLPIPGAPGASTP